MTEEPSFAEWVCLALVAEGASNGWAVGSELAPEAELGRIWSLSRPLAYRAVDVLVERGYVERQEAAGGRGRARTQLSVRPAGRRALRRWLEQPVGHLRDVRIELLVKLTLRSRAGLDNDGLLAEQAEVLAPMIDALTASTDQDLVGVWRREHARAVQRFLARIGRTVPDAVERPLGVRLSARNQLRAQVRAVRHGAVMSTVESVLPDGQRLTASITRDAAFELDLAPGDDVVLIIKSTEVLVATLDL
ncbi:MAG: TOBE domain-containing protein [Desertimonas sp.]